VAALTSAAPALYPHRVLLSVGFIVVIMVGNLRGVRDSAAAFALPVYGFVTCAVITIVGGLWACRAGRYCPIPGHLFDPGAAQRLPDPARLLLRLRQPHRDRGRGQRRAGLSPAAGHNAARVMVYLAVILGTTVIGVAYLAHAMNIVPLTTETVLSRSGPRSSAAV